MTSLRSDAAAERALDVTTGTFRCRLVAQTWSLVECLGPFPCQVYEFWIRRLQVFLRTKRTGNSERVEMKTSHVPTREGQARQDSLLHAKIDPGPQNRPRQQGPLGKSWLTSQAYRLPAALIR